jgi:ABC-type branched-subunit amino acid transport system ATPase component
MVKLLEAVNVSLTLGLRKILDSISLSFNGEISLIAGPNGSGKTTLLKILAGVLKPSSGRVLLDGVDVTLKKACERVKLGIVMAPERMKLPLTLTVDEILRLCDREKAYEYFPELKRISKRKARDLSGGERQMVILARALATNSKYLLLDEPFQGLHEEIKGRVLELLEEEKRDRGIIIATHDELEKVLMMSNFICVLLGGRVFYAGGRDRGRDVLTKFFIGP